MNPGIYTISAEEYHAIDALSASGLKLLAESPAHYKYAIREETRAMFIGSSTHCAVFEPERFKAEYVIAPNGDKRTKAVQAAWAELEAGGKRILTEEEFADVTGMARSVLEDETAGEIVNGGMPERSIFWSSSIIYNGMPVEVFCKARPDYIREVEGRYDIIDLKTTLNAKPHAFTRVSNDYGFHVQAAHYHAGCTSVLDMPVGSFVFIAVEKKPPYALMVYVANQNFINLGYSENNRLKALYAKCQTEGKWPKYANNVQELDVPAWAKN